LYRSSRLTQRGIPHRRVLPPRLCGE